MSVIAFWQPLRRKLPALILTLLVVMTGAFTWLAYRQLSRALVLAAAERVTSVSGRLATAFGDMEDRVRLDKRRPHADSVLLRFLSQRDASTARQARETLDTYPSRTNQTVAIELWGRNGQLLLSSGSTSNRVAATPVTGAFASGSSYGPFVASGDTVFTEIRLPLVRGTADTVGVVRLLQRLGNDQGGALLRQLIGSDAIMLVGNATGDVWTDMSRRVPAPQGFDANAAHDGGLASPDGGRWVGATARVSQVPWVVWVALPRAAALAPARTLLHGIGVVALIILGVGGVAAFVIGRHLMRPLADITTAAEHIASGDYSRRVAVTQGDEVGRLAVAFNSMTAQVASATSELEAQALELELRNQELAEAVSEGSRALAAVLASEARFRSVVEAATDAILTTSADGKILFWNAAAQNIYGYSAAEAVGTSIHRLIPEVRRDAHLAEFTQLAAGEAPQLATGVLVRDAVRKDGTIIPVEVAVSRWETGGETFITSVVRDISGRALLEARLAHQASHDALTGLTNRACFRERVMSALARDPRQADHVAVLFLDLDDFKAVNDTAGHAAGDRLLTVAGERLLSATRGTDTVARLGGDEFGILLWHVEGRDDVDIVAARVIAAMRRPVALGDREVTVGVSIGIARGAEGITADSLLQNADTALYAAKDAGKGDYAWFAPAMHDALLERAQIQSDLGRALERGEFWLAYQPIVDLDAGHVQGVEALVRWTHPERGQLSPAAFIPVAEASGQIVQLGRWVLAEACRQVAQFPGTPHVTVNISGRQLEDPALVDDVAAALGASGLAPTRLFLEITETVLMADTEGTLERLSVLKALGVRLAIDDFGTGYSSLRYLQRFPVDVLKIDKSFVDRVDGDDHDAALVRTIVALGDMLGLTTVAEGIERSAQRDHLVALGCVLGQGHHFARPLDAEATQAFLAGELLARRRAPTVLAGAVEPTASPQTASTTRVLKWKARA